MNRIKCECCGELHDAENIDIVFKKPMSYFLVPEAERENRLDHESDDFIVIDNSTFLVRGVLPIPVHEHDEFCWGAWVKVDEQTFADIWHMHEHDGTGMIYEGLLDIEPTGYDGAYEAKIRIELQKPDLRPRFMFQDNTCKMAHEQNEGVSLHEISELRERLLG
ncbi:DUF2199 domain-containing protein [Aliikangiella sp. IMCC44653]